MWGPFSEGGAANPRLQDRHGWLVIEEQSQPHGQIVELLEAEDLELLLVDLNDVFSGGCDAPWPDVSSGQPFPDCVAC